MIQRRGMHRWLYLFGERYALERLRCGLLVAIGFGSVLVIGLGLFAFCVVFIVVFSAIGSAVLCGIVSIHRLVAVLAGLVAVGELALGGFLARIAIGRWLLGGLF